MDNFIDELLAEAEENEKQLHLAHIDLMLSEMKKLESEIETNFEQAEEEKRIIDSWAVSKNLKLQERIERITTLLKLFMDSQGNEVKTIDLPHGRLQRRRQPDKIEIVDLEKFLSNADRSMVTLQPEIVKPNLNKIKAYYRMTQKLPEGTRLIEGKEKFSIKLNNSQNKEEEANGKKQTRVGTEQTNSYRDAV